MTTQTSETAVYSRNNPHRGAWLVYLNGIEIPCPQVSISYGVWQIPEASLTFAPHKLLQRLGNGDRIAVVIFYLDTLADPTNPEFKLCFEGDIVGYSYSNSRSGRSMTFNCLGDISIFTVLHFYFMNTVDAIAGSVGNNLNAESLTQPGVSYPFSLFTKGLFPSTSTDTPPVTVNTPFEILYNVVRGLLEQRLNPVQQSLPAINFFARWARKKNLPNRFHALPLFEDVADPNQGVFPIFKAVQGSLALDTIQQNLATSVGDSGSIFDVLKQILGVAYFELAMIPTAPCLRVNLADGKILGDADTPPSSAANANKEPLRIGNYYCKPQMLFGIAPSCNVIFPSLTPRWSYQENYSTQPTRTYVNDSLISGFVQQNSITMSALTLAYPPEVNAAVQEHAEETGAAKAITKNGKNVLVFPEEYFKGPVTARMPVPAWFSLLKSRSPSGKQSATPAVASEPNPQEGVISSLFSLYAQYEHYRMRYEKRGGAVEMAFNPYVLPGYPCVVFDAQSSNLTTMGYAMNVTQSFDANGSMSTSMNYGFGRTLPEMLAQLVSDMNRLGVVLGSAPADPVDQVRQISQDFTQAEGFYNALLFGRRPTPGRKASFDFTDVIGLAKDDKQKFGVNQDVSTLSFIGPKSADKTVTFLGSAASSALAQAVGIVNAAVSAGPPSSLASPPPTLLVDNVPITNGDLTRDIVPLPGFRNIFKSYDDAMQYISRPICTLKEYLRFLYPGQSLQDLTQNSNNLGDLVSTYDNGSGSGVYWTRIYQLRQGPADPPVPAQTGANVSAPPSGGTTNTATVFPGTLQGVPPTFAQTAAPWDDALLAYRKEILSRQAPQL